MNRHYPVSDEALIEAIKEGDKNAAAWLYHRHVDRVNRICYRIVLDPSHLQDCVQEVWLKVFRNIDRFQCSKSFAGWLNAVTANTAIDYYRKWIRHENRIGSNEIKVVVTDENPGERKLDGALIEQRIREALEKVSVNQRTSFILRYFEEMPITEIAETLGCTEGAVRTHIRRSLLALRSKLAGKLSQ
jgi:RNA polymerase sigma-70 factor (ECF subfamily)